MKDSQWRAYTDLAWMEHIISSPEEYVDDTEFFCKLIKEHSRIEVKSLLHLGCGAGGNDFTFKKYFKVTSVDISEDMLRIAREVNPEVTYIHGDMRSIELEEFFDVIAVPDSIGHMVTLEDLQEAVLTAYKHLKPGGVFFVVASIAEEFQENNFVYTGAKNGVEVTLFENNYIPYPDGTTYEATVVYLIRQNGELEIHSDTDTISLFSQLTWSDLLKKTGFEVKQVRLEHSYDRYLMDSGEYILSMFICRKSI